ncbi:MAG: PD-(D/E)XK nuclease family transposase [Synergistetes bacterium ADurb.Bin155]|nr:MAG: PD-(D/E)XK nuclease family transposase [Synergistetes bacterium ADurb.Bin155]
MYILDDRRDGEKFFNLTHDMVFKIVFSSPGNERLLTLLLNALLQLRGKDQIESLEILNPFNLPEYRNDKHSIIDVRAMDKAGRRYCIEVQMRAHKELIKRVVYYSSVSYARQLAKSGSYADLNKTVCLWIMGETIIGEPDIYNKFLISHVETHKPLTDLIEYHFVELSKFDGEKPAKLRSRFEKWLHILKFGDLYRSVEDLPEDLKKEPGIIEVVNNMAIANTDEHLRELLISREMFLLDMNTEKQAARKEGRQEGLEEGRQEGIMLVAQNLLKMGQSIEDVCKATGLLPEQVKKLAGMNLLAETASPYSPVRKTNKKRK